MEIEHLDLPGLMLVTPRVFEDGRGSFSEMFNEREFQRRTGVDFRVVQVNRSVSAQINTIRSTYVILILFVSVCKPRRFVLC